MRSGLVSTLPELPVPARARRSRLVTLVLLGLLIAAFAGNRAGGQPPPMDAKDFATINVAVSKGQLFLQRSQNQDGSWVDKEKADHPIGTTALCGLALVECGVPKNDAGLMRARQFVLNGTPKL